MKTRFYLVKFTCVCGEYEFGSQTVLILQPRQRIASQLHHYFQEFYGKENLVEATRSEGSKHWYLSYLYNGGEVAVKQIGVYEISAEENSVLTGLGLA